MGQVCDFSTYCCGCEKVIYKDSNTNQLKCFECETMTCFLCGLEGTDQHFTEYPCLKITKRDRLMVKDENDNGVPEKQMRKILKGGKWVELERKVIKGFYQ